jgi:hypothetical protein
MLGDGEGFRRRATGISFLNVARKVGSISEIQRLFAFRSAFAGASSCVGVCEALLLCAEKRAFLNEDTLPFVSTPAATETHEDRPELGIPGGAPRQGGVSRWHEHEMGQIRARHAERPLTLHA